MQPALPSRDGRQRVPTTAKRGGVIAAAIGFALLADKFGT
jgi:hypothetical protein